MTDKPLPCIRSDIEVLPALADGEKILVVRDELDLHGEGHIVISPLLAFIGSMLDGKQTLVDIQYELMKHLDGALVTADQVNDAIHTLDEYYLLENDRFRKAKKDFCKQYASQEKRDSSLSGKAYPEDPEELQLLLDEMLALFEGDEIEEGTLRGLVAPHIDLNAGQRVYASAYAPLTGMHFERVVIFGTGHKIDDGYFSLTGKDYETPLGRVKTDIETVRALTEAGKGAVCKYDIAHRNEHSIEFQLLFLQHVLKPSFKLIPILCGHFAGELENYSRAGEMPGVDSLLSTLEELMDDWGDTLVVAGVDFSHVGRKFGDGMAGRSMAAEAEEHDRNLIENFCKADQEGFWAESCSVSDRYHVCGFSSMACMMELLPGSMGILTDYEMWHEDATESAVSFAAIQKY